MNLHSAKKTFSYNGKLYAAAKTDICQLKLLSFNRAISARASFFRQRDLCYLDAQ